MRPCVLRSFAFPLKQASSFLATSQTLRHRISPALFPASGAPGHPPLEDIEGQEKNLKEISTCCAQQEKNLKKMFSAQRAARGEYHETSHHFKLEGGDRSNFCYFGSVRTVSDAAGWLQMFCGPLLFVDFMVGGVVIATTAN